MVDEADVCVAVQGVSKKFSRSLKHSFIYGAREIGRAVLGRGGDETLSKHEFWAVRDVSFELRRGRSIGVIGLNGSGKTTLMRMISGVLRPTAGKIRVQGRIAPMLALGAGFKPVLSGRENIFLNLSLLGVAHRDIVKRYDAIVEFSEIAESISAPIGTYSSGMVARLGFACAVHTNPQILVVDEVLSVGDAKFRAKCRNKINELRKNGTSMLLVSHSSILIETLSDECLYLRRGDMAALGRPSDVLKIYEADNVQHAAAANAARIDQLGQRQEGSDEGPIGIRTVRFTAPATSGNGFWLSGKPGEIIIDVACPQKLKNISINLLIFDLTHQPGETVQFFKSSRDIGWLDIEPGRVELRLTLPVVGLRPGTYRVKISISQGDIHDLLDVVDNLKLVVRDMGLTSNCLYYQTRDWHVTGGHVTRAPALPEEVMLEETENF